MTDTIVADISEFQGPIDWAAYGAAVPGVIIRAHNGYRADNYWPANLAGARGHVGWRGFYQYLPAGVDPAAAAHAFQAATGPLLPGEVAILDLEEGSGDQRGRRQAWLDALRDPIEWTYSGLAFARAHLPGVRVEWLAAYGQGEPTDPHDVWQFTDARSFPGISRPCDASVYHGNLTSLVSNVISSGGSTAVVPTLTPLASLSEDDMDANQASQLAEAHEWAQQTVEAVGRLEAIYGAADARNRAGIIDDTHDKVLEIHNGVAGLPTLLAAGQGTPADPAAIAAEIIAHLGSDLAAQVATHLTITTTGA
jgi:Glycosyl hydrolases family 25